jgi:hypothetical protein
MQYVSITFNLNYICHQNQKGKLWNLKKSLFFIDDNKDDVRKKKPNENMDVFDVTLESTNKNSQSFQYPVDNDKNCNLEKSSRSIMTTNQMNEHDDS